MDDIKKAKLKELLNKLKSGKRVDVKVGDTLIFHEEGDPRYTTFGVQLMVIIQNLLDGEDAPWIEIL